MTKEETAKELKRLGTRRRRAIDTQRAVESEIRPLLPAAVADGIPLREIRDLTGLSVNTIRLWAGEDATRKGGTDA